jgi:hypothetical protein
MKKTTSQQKLRYQIYDLVKKPPCKFSVESKSKILLNMSYMFQKSTNEIKQKTKQTLL